MRSSREVESDSRLMPMTILYATHPEIPSNTQQWFVQRLYYSTIDDVTGTEEFNSITIGLRVAFRAADSAVRYAC